MDSSSYLESLRTPRMYCSISFEDANHKDFLVYADTSKNTVVVVAYLKMYDGRTFTTSFLKGKAKLDPMHDFLVWNYVKLYLPPI